MANSVSRDPKSIPDSYFINQLESLDVNWIGNSNFAIFGIEHQMLIYGAEALISSMNGLSNNDVFLSKRAILNKILKLLKLLVRGR